MTFNPLVDEGDFASFSLRQSRPVPRASTALVLQRNSGELFVPAQAVTVGETLFGGLRRWYEVTLRNHHFDFSYRLPSKEEALFFDARIQVICRVSRPLVVVRSEITDVEGLCKEHLVPWLCGVSRGYGIEQSADVERAVREEFAHSSLRLEEDYGVALVRCGVRVKLDEETERHVAARTLATRDREAAERDSATERVRLKSQHEIDALREELAASEREVRTLRDHEHGLEVARNRAEQLEVEHQAEALEQHYRQKLEKERHAHELELKQQRMEFYRRAAELGDQSLLLLQLTEHPDDVRSVIEFLAQRDESIRLNGTRITEALIRGDLLTRSDSSQLREEVVKQLIGQMHAPSVGLTTQTPALPESAADLRDPSVEVVDSPPSDAHDGPQPHHGDDYDYDEDEDDE
jgi:hypothetical protein